MKVVHPFPMSSRRWMLSNKSRGLAGKKNKVIWLWLFYTINLE